MSFHIEIPGTGLCEQAEDQSAAQQNALNQIEEHGATGGAIDDELELAAEIVLLLPIDALRAELVPQLLQLDELVLSDLLRRILRGHSLEHRAQFIHFMDQLGGNDRDIRRPVHAVYRQHILRDQAAERLANGSRADTQRLRDRSSRQRLAGLESAAPQALLNPLVSDFLQGRVFDLLELHYGRSSMKG